ncbi:MAG: GNAT family N-acetyltransferase [Candidatus Korarchaeota archaeon]
MKFRPFNIENDISWLTEFHNDPESAKYFLTIYPQTEYAVSEDLKDGLKEGKHIVAELNGEPAGMINIWTGDGRDRHIGGLAIGVRRQYWGKGVGTALMKEGIKVAKELGCRKLFLGVFEGNERAITLYQKIGFVVEACEEDAVYIDGTWRRMYIMGLELAPCEPRFEASKIEINSGKTLENGNIWVRHLRTKDLDEVNRLQNCTESTKSSSIVPPITKEYTKRWYEKIRPINGYYCIAAFNDEERLLGYLLFRANTLPFANLKSDEIIVDINQKPEETANALIKALVSFKERYGYHKIFAYVPQKSYCIVTALQKNDFKNVGTSHAYYYIDGQYVDLEHYQYP